MISCITVLIGMLLLDALLGDPRVAWHPVCLIGRSLSFFEEKLRQIGWNGYGGGILLFFCLAVTWVLPVTGIMIWLAGEMPIAGWLFQIITGFFLLAIHSLLTHSWNILKAADSGNLALAHQETAKLVGRDTEPMSLDDCRRSAVESMGESLTDGIIAPLFYYFLLGIPGMLVFKIISTMDSMVGYKTEKYLKFGWFGARADDVLNYIPARLSFILITLLASVLPGYSGRYAFKIGWSQHHLIPGPNAGWSEAAMAGALRIRIAGPIWKKGVKVTELWIGDAQDPETCSHGEVFKTMAMVVLSSLVFCMVSIFTIFWIVG
ncbi:MAG: cobalamin biosynthesis protein CobD [SAR324 cluster bacterium]|nr:cobalamin biosynthesis protein CobD [SAR324 cluster bacterium]